MSECDNSPKKLSFEKQVADSFKAVKQAELPVHPPLAGGRQHGSCACDGSDDKRLVLQLVAATLVQASNSALTAELQRYLLQLQRTSVA